MRNDIRGLEERLEDKHRECCQLQQLVSNMESSATNEEVIRTEIDTLQYDLQNAEGEIYERLSERAT